MKKKSKLKSKSKTNDEEICETQSDFSFTITRIAVSQICRSIVGFKGAQSTVVDTLTLITTKYLQSLAKTAISFSNAASRTESNLFDIVNSLNDPTLSTRGLFNGPSALRGDCLLMSSSGVLKEIMDFVSSTNEIPFAKPIPRIKNVPCNWVSENRVSNDRRALCLHIPKWLPPFPDQVGLDQSINDSRIEREKLWEDSDKVVVISKGFGLESSVSGCSSVRNGSDLPSGRAKVSFKIEGGKGAAINKGAVNVRNGMCRGGKRVCWNGNAAKESDSKIDENQEKLRGGVVESRQVKLLTYKRRKKIAS